MKIKESPWTPPPCESNTKVQKFDGNNTHRCSDRSVALARGGGGGGTRPWCCFICRSRRLLASRHCTFRSSVGRWGYMHTT